jgi:hypothetical protein
VYWSGYDTTALDIEVDPLGSVCVCLLLQDLVQRCLHGGGGGVWEDMCYERRRAEACVD